MILIRGGPYVTIRGEVSAHALQRLPCKFYCSIRGRIEIGPIEGRSIAGNLGCVQQVVENPVECVRILQTKIHLFGVSKCANEMDVRKLDEQDSDQHMYIFKQLAISDSPSSRRHWHSDRTS